MALKRRLQRLQRGLCSGLARRFPPCVALLPATTPVCVRHFDCGQRARELIVFLPGIDDVVDDFEFNGFIAEVRKRDVAADLLVTDLHFGYYLRLTAIERLHADVIALAKARYERIWLVGISLGGLGSVLYAMEHPKSVCGLILFAPYPGDPLLLDEIESAGGLRNWQPGEVREGDYQRRMWQWLQDYAFDRHTPKIYLGYGQSDAFARGNRMLAQVLPNDHVFVVPGGHNWATWKKLWRELLTSWLAQFAKN